jgi:hypothetical protein
MARLGGIEELVPLRVHRGEEYCRHGARSEPGTERTERAERAEQSRAEQSRAEQRNIAIGA